MRTALERQLAITGWQALGFVLGLSALVALGTFWGARIESRIDQAERDRHHDHRAIVALQRGEPAAGGDADQTASTGGQQPSPRTGGDRTPKGTGKPPKSHSPAPLEPQQQPPPTPAPVSPSPAPVLEAEPEHVPPGQEKKPLREAVRAATDADIPGVLEGVKNTPCLLTPNC